MKRIWQCPKCSFNMEASEGALKGYCLVCGSECELEGGDGEDGEKEAGR